MHGTSDWVLLPLAPVPAERARQWFAGIDGLTVRLPAGRSAAAVREAIPEADIVISDWSGALRVDAPEVAAAGRLAFLMSPSVGLDNIDLEAPTDAGVVVANTAGLNASSVAEWCVAAAFAVARSLVWVDRQVRDGAWPQLELPGRGSTELGGLRVGVLGFGAVGSRVAGLFAAIGCEVAYWTRLGAIETGALLGAAIDVFEMEPLPADSPLRGSDRILLSSHAAATTAQSIGRILGLVGANVRRAIAGEPIGSVVNGLDPIVRRRTGR